jgi:anti-sigma B factor antagonist
MNITYRIDKDILYIAMEGRIDASNAAEAEERIFSIKRENPDKHTVLDADQLAYISSAGLRVLLSAHKTMMKQGQMKVTNASEIVKEVFEVTGFCDILNIE